MKLFFAKPLESLPSVYLAIKVSLYDFMLMHTLARKRGHPIGGKRGVGDVDRGHSGCNCARGVGREAA